MTINVVFLDQDTVGWAAFEEKVGLSNSNKDGGNGCIILIWKEVGLEKAIQLLKAAHESPAVLYLSLEPALEAPKSTEPGLRLVGV